MNSDIITTTFNVATASTIVEEGGVDDPTTFNVATAPTIVEEGRVDDPSPTIDSATTIEEGCTGHSHKSMDHSVLPNMPTAGNNASVMPSDHTTTVNVASTLTVNVASTLIAEGGGLKERINQYKVRFFY